MKLKINCAICNKTLLAKKRTAHHALVNNNIELVCGSCYKYVLFNDSGFKKIKEE